MKRLMLAAIAAALVGGCSDDNPLAPMPPVLKVMTYNVYLGADESPLLAVPAGQVPLAAAQVWATVRATNFPERAGALARQIARANPDLVGLQEVVLFRVQSPGDAAAAGTTPATTVRYDFLKLLLDSLAARGLGYAAVAADTTSDVEVPVLTGVDGAGNPSFDDVRLTDRDAILVRDGVAFANPQSARFATNMPVSVGGVPAEIVRGWGAVDATVNGITVRFVNTHLLDFVPDIQVAQALEILAGPARTALPVILVGDLNTDATGATTATYGLLADSSFADAWLRAWPNLPGFTSGQAADLANASSRLAQRIDFILTRESGAAMPALSAVQHAAVYGAAAADRTRGGLWPSDHAAVEATFQLRRP